jgi:hypothetical protein
MAHCARKMAAYGLLAGVDLTAIMKTLERLDKRLAERVRSRNGSRTSLAGSAPVGLDNLLWSSRFNPASAPAK